METLDTTILLPKKSGKSSICAALALYRLSSNPHASIAVAAAAREQAAYIFRAAATMVARSPWLKDEFVVLPGRKEIRHRSGTGQLTILAATAKTADGWIGDLALLDEVGHWRSIAMLTVLKGGVARVAGK